MTATVSLGEVAEINPRCDTDGVLATDAVDFFPMAVVDADKTVARASERRALQQVSKGFTSFRDGDVLLAKITPCFENGKISQASVTTPVAFGSTEFHVVRCGAKLDSRYLVHFLRRQEVRSDGERKMTGSGGQRRVPKHFLESLGIPLPPIPEQRRIAAILDKADALRAKRCEALAQLDHLAQSIFVEMFGDPATNPKGWAVRTLKDLGKVSTGGTPPSALDDMFGGEIPFITPGDLESDKTVKRTVTLAGAQEAGTVRAGAALICCIGTVGKMGMALVRSSFNQQLNAVEWYPMHIHDLYGLAVLRFFKPTIVSWASSTTIPILKKSTFEKITIPVPPIAMQEEFAKRIFALRHLEKNMRSDLKVGADLFLAIQSRAFEGRL